MALLRTVVTTDRLKPRTVSRIAPSGADLWVPEGAYLLNNGAGTPR